MNSLDYVEHHGDRVEYGVTIEHVEVWDKQNVIVDDVALSGKEKSMLFSFD